MKWIPIAVAVLCLAGCSKPRPCRIIEVSTRTAQDIFGETTKSTSTLIEYTDTKERKWIYGYIGKVGEEFSR